MVKLKSFDDPTLKAADEALEERENSSTPRGWLGFSSAGDCERKQDYRFSFADAEKFNAKTLKNFADGHRTEDLVIERLRLVSGVTVISHDPDTNRQIEVEDFNGHFRGHLDGEVLGLQQAPKTWHVLEVKCVGEANFRKFQKIKSAHGEKNTLKEWNEVYYAQHQLYMLYRGHKRGYLIVASAGGRDWDAVRTNLDKEAATFYARRAQRIIENRDLLPPRVSDNPSVPPCVWCEYKAICHEGKLPARNCRTCIFSEPRLNGGWHCQKHEKTLSYNEQREGCIDQRYRPALINGEIREITDDTITYFVEDREWTDKGGILTSKKENG